MLDKRLYKRDRDMDTSSEYSKLSSKRSKVYYTSEILDDQSSRHHSENDECPLFKIAISREGRDIRVQAEEIRTPSKESSEEESSSEESEEEESSSNQEDTEEESSSEEETMTKTEKYLKKVNPEIFNILTNVKKEILKKEPCIVKILREPLRTEDRVMLVQMYEIYKNLDINTEEWFEYRSRLNNKFKEAKTAYNEYSKYTKEEQKEMEDLATTLTSQNSHVALYYKILGLNCGHEVKSVIYQRYEEYKDTNIYDDEYNKLKSWLTWSVNSPHDTIKKFPFAKDQLTIFLQQVSNRLDEELYGMQKAKEQILVFLNSKITNPSMKRCNLGLIGPPGVGKTSIARLLASALNFPFEQISVGGAHNDTFLKGHSYTYIGSCPGELVKCLKRMGCKNGILFLDEFEKTAENSEVRNAMLQVTDPVQSHVFVDNFLSYPIDLSCLWQIYSMNSLPSDEALCDRIFTVNVEGYNYTDKLSIVQKFLLPKALKNVGLPTDYVTINNKGSSYLISRICTQFDKGVRSLERGITDLVNKINFIVQNQNENGELSGFNVSFQLAHKLESPIKLTPTLVDKLLYRKELDVMTRMMYI